MPKKYRAPSEEGQKQIAMRFLRGESEETINADYLDRGIEIPDITDIVNDPYVRNNVCREMAWRFIDYEAELRKRLTRGSRF